MREPLPIAAAPMPTPTGVLASVEARVSRFFDLLDQLQDDDDVELIHDIRVASRRLREGLGVARQAVQPDRLTPLEAWLREVRDLLSPVRDADVMHQVLADLVGGEVKLAPIPAGLGFVDALRRQRRYRLIDARFQLESAGVLERRDEMTGMLADAVERAGPVTTLEAALVRRLRRRVRRRRRRFEQLAAKAAGSRRPRPLHAARIAGKKIRYALELAHESQVVDAARELTWLRRLQNGLGDLNDLTVLRNRMKAFAEQAGPELLAGMDEVLSLVKRRRRRLVKRFVGDWPKVRRGLRKAKARAHPQGRAHCPQ